MKDVSLAMLKERAASALHLAEDHVAVSTALMQLDMTDRAMAAALIEEGPRNWDGIDKEEWAGVCLRLESLIVQNLIEEEIGPLTQRDIDSLPLVTRTHARQLSYLKSLHEKTQRKRKPLTY
jgi:NADP-dependent 3-hydroxy acid dehydrogenase YdfG